MKRFIKINIHDDKSYSGNVCDKNIHMKHDDVLGREVTHLEEMVFS